MTQFILLFGALFGGLAVLFGAFGEHAYFPTIDLTIWKEVSREEHKADEKNKYDYSLVSYHKKY